VIGKTLICAKDGNGVFVDDALIAQHGVDECRRLLGLPYRRLHPVQTSLSGSYVMVEADSHDEAVNKYLSRANK